MICLILHGSMALSNQQQLTFKESDGLSQEYLSKGLLGLFGRKQTMLNTERDWILVLSVGLGKIKNHLQNYECVKL